MRAVILILLLAAAAAAQQPVGFVNDFAGVISDEDEYIISSELIALEQETGAEIAVVTVTSLPAGETEQSYANILFSEWGVGKQGEDNGILILLAVEERRIWVETGYGLEGILPDARVGRILDANTDALSAGDYGLGLGSIAFDIADVIRAEYVPGAPREQSALVEWFPYLVVGAVIFVFALAFAAAFISNRCPQCTAQLRRETLSQTARETRVKIFCPRCGWHKIAVYAAGAAAMGMAASRGGGSRGGGFSGFGGGRSGGGGAGRGF